MIEPSAIDSYRLLRRALLLSLEKRRQDHPNLNLPEYVELFIGRPIERNAPPGKLAGLVVGKAKSIGLEEKPLAMYSGDEWGQLASAYAKDIAQIEEAAEPESIRRAEVWPEWPEGWRRSLEDVRKAEKRRASAA